MNTIWSPESFCRKGWFLLISQWSDRWPLSYQLLLAERKAEELLFGFETPKEKEGKGEGVGLVAREQTYSVCCRPSEKNSQRAWLNKLHFSLGDRLRQYLLGCLLLFLLIGAMWLMLH
jgi:hypothetical protein